MSSHPFLSRPVLRVPAGQQGLNCPHGARKYAYVSFRARGFAIRNIAQMATFAATFRRRHLTAAFDGEDDESSATRQPRVQKHHRRRLVSCHNMPSRWSSDRTVGSTRSSFSVSACGRAITFVSCRWSLANGSRSSVPFRVTLDSRRNTSTSFGRRCRRASATTSSRSAWP